MTVPCILPRREDYDYMDPPPEHPPEEYGDEWATSERCTHDYCIEVEGYRLSAPKAMSREEREELESDRELMLDEFHGRDLAGNIR